MEEIKSELLNSKMFRFVKNSIIEQAQKDGEVRKRVKTIEYINNNSYDSSDRFFYDMLPYVRFLDPTSEHVAYTTPNKEISLNCPSSPIVKNTMQWEFVYDHECLHQLWDTFAVGDKIKQNGIEFNHAVLNIASDCVINQYLRDIRKKRGPEEGIYPEVLEEKYGVVYNAKNDTQYTLYLKLLEAIKNNKELQQQAQQDGQAPNEQQSGGGGGQGGGQGGQGGGQGGQGGGQGGQDSQSNGGSGGGGQKDKSGKDGQDDQGGQGGQNDPIDNMSGSQAAKEAERQAENAQKAADAAKNNADDSQDGEAEKCAQEAAEHAKKAKEAAEKAKEAANKGDDASARKYAKEAKEHAQKAQENAVQSNQQTGGGKGQGDGTATITITQADLDNIRKGAESVIDKYKSKLSGDLRKFISKCKAAASLKANGLEVTTQSGYSGWNKQMDGIVQSYIKQKIFKFKRQYQQTYTRIKRGSGFVKFGEPINPGRKVKDDTFDVNIAFYVDISGSMSDGIENVWKAVYTISKSLEKLFSRESAIEKFVFTLYAFDTELKPLKWGNKTSVGGGTMDFEQLLDHIIDKTKDYLINVIITDGQMGVDVAKVKKTIKALDGMLIWISNDEGNATHTINELTKSGYADKLSTILAPSDWQLK